MEEIRVPAGISEARRQKIYDAIQAGWEKASEDLFQVDKALKMFYLDFGRFPSLEEGGLNALVDSTGTPLRSIRRFRCGPLGESGIAAFSRRRSSLSS